MSQVKTIKSQGSKFGTVLVVETLPQPQRLLLGFQINPADKLQDLLHATTAVLNRCRTHPDYGIRVDDIVNPNTLLQAAAFTDQDEEEFEEPMPEYDVLALWCI